MNWDWPALMAAPADLVDYLVEVLEEDAHRQAAEARRAKQLR